MMIIEHIQLIMESFDCNLNTAMQLYKRGTFWED